MRQSNQPEAKGISASLRASLMMFIFGLSILAYLVAIDRREWFHIQPGAGTAAAMSEASNRTRPLSEQARARAGSKAAEL